MAFALASLATPAVLAEAEGLSLSVATNWAVLTSNKDNGEEEKDEVGSLCCACLSHAGTRLAGLSRVVMC